MLIAFINILSCYGISINLDILANQQRLTFFVRRCPRGAVDNVVDCDIIVSEFNLKLQHCAHFRTSTLEKGM